MDKIKFPLRLTLLWMFTYPIILSGYFAFVEVTGWNPSELAQSMNGGLVTLIAFTFAFVLLRRDYAKFLAAHSKDQDDQEITQGPKDKKSLSEIADQILWRIVYGIFFIALLLLLAICVIQAFEVFLSYL